MRATSYFLFTFIICNCPTALRALFNWDRRVAGAEAAPAQSDIGLQSSGHRAEMDKGITEYLISSSLELGS